jgi:stringent starvation protein B
MDVRSALDKKLVLAELLEQGMVLVTLDARVDGVAVPPHLCEDAQLRLNLSYRFGLPMELHDDGVNATLTFGGTPFNCALPWGAIYLMVSHVTGRPILFPEDVPQEFYPSGGEVPSLPRLPATPRKPAPPRLELVSTDGEAKVAEAVAEAASEAPTPKDPSRRGHLRVVK